MNCSKVIVMILGSVALLFFVASLISSLTLNQAHAPNPWFMILMNVVFGVLLILAVVAGFRGEEGKYNRIVLISMCALVANYFLQAIV